VVLVSHSTSSSRLPALDPSAARKRREQEDARREFAHYGRQVKLSISILAAAAALAATVFAAANSSSDLAAFSAVGELLGPFGAGILGGLVIGGALYHHERVIQDSPEQRF